MSNIFFVLIVSLFLSEQANCAKVDFVVKLATPHLNLTCTYTLEKNEKLYQVIIKRDITTFIKFNESNKNNPEITKLDGLSNVASIGGGAFIINNFGNKTFGIFSCNVYYDMVSTATKKKSTTKVEPKGTLLITKKYQLSFKWGRCAEYWVPGPDLPDNVYIEAYDKHNVPYIFCRYKMDGRKIPGHYYPGNPPVCEITYNSGIRNSTTFEVMGGQGFTWVTKEISSSNDVPPNGLEAGTDGNDSPLWLGRCTINGILYLGKVRTVGLYVPYNNQEYKCSPSDIIVCNK